MSYIGKVAQGSKDFKIYTWYDNGSVLKIMHRDYVVAKFAGKNRFINAETKRGYRFYE